MSQLTNRIVRYVESTRSVAASRIDTWNSITNVDITSIKHPKSFRLLGIPRPLRADVESEGIGGRRTAYFDNGKRFLQVINVWKPHDTYGFTFNPERGFTVLWVFELADGVVQIPTGIYELSTDGDDTRIVLGTQYSIARNWYWLFAVPVRLSLRLFQRHLLRSIEHNAVAS